MSYRALHNQVLRTALEPHVSCHQIWLNHTHHHAILLPLTSHISTLTWQCPYTWLLIWRKHCIFLFSLGTSSLTVLCSLLVLLLLLSRFSRVRLCATPQTAAHQAPPPLGFSRQEHWSGLPFPSPMHESEKWKWSRSVVSDSVRPHGLQSTRLLRPWDFPGKSTGVGCHCLICPVFPRLLLLGCAQSSLILCDHMGCSLPGSSVHGIFQARIVEHVAIFYSRGSSWPKTQTWVLQCKCLLHWQADSLPLHHLRSPCVAHTFLYDSSQL